MAEIDADDVARLRIALARIARVLDRQSRGHTLTGTQASVLATAARLGPVRITELAEIEGINPTMMSRIVGKLEDAGLLHRRADPDDRRAALVEPTTAGRELQRHVREERTRLLAEQARRAPGRARRRRARRTAPPRSARHGAPQPHTRRTPLDHALRRPPPGVLVAGQPELPPLHPRPGRLARGHLDADDRPVLAGARAHRLGRRARRRHRPPDPADAAARPLRGRRRRPHGQAPPHDRPAGRDGRAGAGARPADDHRRSSRSGRSTCWHCCSGSTTASRTRPGSRSCWRWSAPTICATP